MLLLWDTCALIWWEGDKSRLSSIAQAAIEDPANDVAASILSYWEVGLKVARGKLPMQSDVQTFMRRSQKGGIGIIPIPLAGPVVISQLPFHHNDPFDRMLVATAQMENYVVVTPDIIFDKYGVTRLW